MAFLIHLESGAAVPSLAAVRSRRRWDVAVGVSSHILTSFYLAVITLATPLSISAWR